MWSYRAAPQRIDLDSKFPYKNETKLRYLSAEFSYFLFCWGRSHTLLMKEGVAEPIYTEWRPEYRGVPSPFLFLLQSRSSEEGSHGGSYCVNDKDAHKSELLS